MRGPPDPKCETAPLKTGRLIAGQTLRSPKKLPKRRRRIKSDLRSRFKHSAWPIVSRSRRPWPLRWLP